MNALTRPRGAWLAVLRVCQADAHRLDHEFGGILKDALLAIPSLQVRLTSPPDFSHLPIAYLTPHSRGLSGLQMNVGWPLTSPYMRFGSSQ